MIPQSEIRAAAGRYGVEAIELIPARLRTLLRREFPDMTWSAAEPTDRMVTALVEAGTRSVKVQLVEPRQREDQIPTISTEVELRYSDLPATVTLRVPSPPGFAAMKLMAWHQRQAPRDLVDLSALAGIGAITADAIDLTKQISGTRISKRVLQQRIPPSVLTHWDTQLAHQMASAPRPDECLDRVLAGLDEVDS